MLILFFRCIYCTSHVVVVWDKQFANFVFILWTIFFFFGQCSSVWKQLYFFYDFTIILFSHLNNIFIRRQSSVLPDDECTWVCCVSPKPHFYGNHLQEPHTIALFAPDVCRIFFFFASFGNCIYIYFGCDMYLFVFISCFMTRFTFFSGEFNFNFYTQ